MTELEIKESFCNMYFFKIPDEWYDHPFLLTNLVMECDDPDADVIVQVGINFNIHVQIDVLQRVGDERDVMSLFSTPVNIGGNIPWPIICIKNCSSEPRIWVDWTWIDESEYIPRTISVDSFRTSSLPLRYKFDPNLIFIYEDIINPSMLSIQRVDIEPFPSSQQPLEIDEDVNVDYLSPYSFRVHISDNRTFDLIPTIVINYDEYALWTVLYISDSKVSDIEF